MAWKSDGRTNDELVNNLKKHGIIVRTDVESAMRAVDRGDFIPHNAYKDAPQPIGFSATISAPHMHASALELLAENLKPGSKALDIGSGSGYLAACMAVMVGPAGKVIGIDHIEELVALSRRNVEVHHRDLLLSGRLELIVGDGRKGRKEEAPYDAIHVGAAASQVPQALIEQLRPGGRMVIPVENMLGEQDLVFYHKEVDGTITTQHVMGVMYVPLTSKESQWPPARR
eukprot:Opistho-2@85859